MPSTLKVQEVELKNLFLQMAKDGLRRPKKGEPYYKRLKTFIEPKSKKFDIQFRTNIAELSPSWINISLANKRELYDTAINGEDRPKYHSTLGKLFRNLTNPECKSYDPIFTNMMRMAAPDWFERTIDVKKANLITIASTGLAKVDLSQETRNLINRYTRSNSSVFDASFKEQIGLLAPDWLTTKAKKPKIIKLSKEFRELERLEKFKSQKAEILRLAKEGIERRELPPALLNLIYNRTRSNADSYDHEFTMQLEEISPHWIPKSLDN